jgi:hypothetical protein
MDHPAHDVSMGCAADARRMAFREDKTIMIAVKVHTPAGDGTLHCDTLASGSVAPNFERLKFPGARRRLAVVGQPRVGSVLELSRPEMACRIPRDLTSRSTTFKPNERSWHFNGYESTLAWNRTHRSPMLPHEILPVSRASVVGMTIWVGQGQSHLPADVPGFTTTSGRGGRLRPKGRLRQQPAGIYINWRPEPTKTMKPLTNALLKVAGTRQERQRPETSVTPATHCLHQSQRVSPSSTKGSEADQGHI